MTVVKGQVKRYLLSFASSILSILATRDKKTKMNCEGWTSCPCWSQSWPVVAALQERRPCRRWCEWAWSGWTCRTEWGARAPCRRGLRWSPAAASAPAPWHSIGWGGRPYCLLPRGNEWGIWGGVPKTGRQKKDCFTTVWAKPRTAQGRRKKVL